MSVSWRCLSRIESLPPGEFAQHCFPNRVPFGSAVRIPESTSFFLHFLQSACQSLRQWLLTCLSPKASVPMISSLSQRHQWLRFSHQSKEPDFNTNTTAPRVNRNLSVQSLVPSHQLGFVGFTHPKRSLHPTIRRLISKVIFQTHPLLLTATILTLMPIIGVAASFDCTKAVSRTERMICTNASLSELDDKLAETFSLELEREAFITSLRASQRNWLNQRNSCQDIACIRLRYEQRIAQLSCDPQSRMAGSASGVSQCSYFTLRILEPALIRLEEQFSRRSVSESNNPDGKFAAEQQAWRKHREAQCTLYGETEGGADEWKNAFAGICEVDETKKQIAHLKRELARRPQ